MLNNKRLFFVVDNARHEDSLSSVVKELKPSLPAAGSYSLHGHEHLYQSFHRNSQQESECKLPRWDKQLPPSVSPVQNYCKYKRQSQSCSQTHKARHTLNNHQATDWQHRSRTDSLSASMCEHNSKKEKNRSATFLFSVSIHHTAPYLVGTSWHKWSNKYRLYQLNTDVINMYLSISR